MSKLLIIIDVQKFFINNFTKDLPKKIRSFLLEKKNNFDFIIFFKFVNNQNSNFTKKLVFNRCLTPEESELVDELKEFVNDDNLFVKDTYSVFKSKDLLQFIKNNQITKIVLCGLNSDGCLLASAFDGFDLGFDIEIIKELTGNSWGNYNDFMIKILGHKIDPNLLQEKD